MNKNNWLEDYYELENRILITFNSVSKRIPRKSLDNIDIVLNVLIKRISNNYNAIKLLMRNKMHLEALMIIRSVIESTFVFNGLFEKPIDTYDILLKLSHNNIKELQKKALKYDDLKANARKFDFSDLEASYTSIKKISELSLKNKDLYDIPYKMISDVVHINLNSIEKFLELEDDKSCKIKDRLSSSEVEAAYLTLLYCMLMIIEGLNLKYNLKFNKDIACIEKLLDEVKLFFLYIEY